MYTAYTEIVQEMLRHLPPSGSQLRVLFFNPSDDASLAAIIQRQRPDTRIVSVKTSMPSANPPFDAAFIVMKSAAELDMGKQFQQRAYHVLRAGGRLIVFEQGADSPEKAANHLQNMGYVRVLGESCFKGVLYRGEIAYDPSLSTLDRVEMGTKSEVQASTLVSGNAIVAIKGRYIYVPVHQIPNKPVWRLDPAEQLQWTGFVVKNRNNEQQALLAFTSLPKAVQFLQHMVKANVVLDVNKIPKFAKATAAHWQFAIVINLEPAEFLATHRLSQQTVYLDPSSAEAPDE